jgi:hypothetical protein
MFMLNRVAAVVCLYLLTHSFIHGQNLKSTKPKKPIVCYAKAGDEFTVVKPPKEYLRWERNPNARTQSATFDVTYVGFTTEAKAAFQKAVDIWATQISSTQTIHVYAEWTALEPGVLGSAIWGNAFANFPGAQQVNTYYPVAMAEKMARQDLNPSDEPDIVANFSSVFDWSYRTDGVAVAGKYDLVTVVLHELGHGLGWVDSYSSADELGTVGVDAEGNPIIYDLALENATGQNLFLNFTAPSAELKTQLVSKGIYFNTPLSFAANVNKPAKIYAPSTFSPGSSISHLDESTFPEGNANSLMTPQFGSAEVIHDPGPIVMGAFSDMGWVTTTIQHDSLSNREAVANSFTVIAKIFTDTEPLTNIKLHYNSGSADVVVDMTSTGSPNEYLAEIPSTGSATTYAYFISVDDAIRNYTAPGKLHIVGEGFEQKYYTFKTGPDTTPPTIKHVAKKVILDTDTELKISATVKDELGVESVRLDYFINNIAKPSKQLLWNEVDGNQFDFTISFPANSLSVGDVIKYRIIARDTAVIGSANGNVAYSPSSTDYYFVDVTGLQSPRDYYVNDFNASTEDFFGEGFDIETPEGFADGAINTLHPYIEGNGQPANEINSTYELLVPIKLKSKYATIEFDEIVLVEPGADGSEFGEADFFDYVIVEGSTDGGATWKAVADGYDSRNNADWLTHWNSKKSGSNSTAVGDPSLYRKRVLNLLNTFSPGQEVILRFRLFSDAFAVGWGWAIDNLRIQIDDTPPQVLHNHIDYIHSDETTLSITTKVADVSPIKSIVVEYGTNGGQTQSTPLDIVPNASQYTFDLALSGFTAGDVIQYRIIATDSADNEGTFPKAGFINTTLFTPATAVSQYVNDFSVASDDFIGNFFTITKPTGLVNSINTAHNYENGMGLDYTSNYAYMLTKPIILSADNPYIKFNEIVIVEGQSSAIKFGSAGFNDYVIVEGSIDGGTTWVAFLDGYDAVKQSSWLSAFNFNTQITSSLRKSRTINMLDKSGFHENDHVLIRFRLFANETKNGWGWAIDNLSIQGAITAVEEKIENLNFQLYPNPAQEKITVEVVAENYKTLSLQIMGSQGQSISTNQFNLNGKTFKHEIDLKNMPAGLYIMRAHVGDKIITKKFTMEN